jgi:5-methylcytosine-specific restriction protein A
VIKYAQETIKTLSSPRVPGTDRGKVLQQTSKTGIPREYNRKHRPYQKLYKTARWQRLRKRLLSEHPLCTLCKLQGRITPATVADHIIPHKGNLELFWDEDNLQALCKPCHDRKTAKEGRWGEKGKVYTY